MNKIIRTVTVSKVERLRNTRSGNPRWRFTLTDGTTVETTPDTAWAHLADSVQPGDKLPLVIDQAGRIKGAPFVATITEINQEHLDGAFYDTVVITRDAVEIGRVYVASSEDPEPYDRAVRARLGSDDFIWGESSAV